MMKPIQVHKRLYSVLPRGVPASPSSSRAPSSRSFYSGPQLPLTFFDPPPPPPLPSSRPNLGSTLRLIQAKPEAETPSSPQNNSQSHNQSAQAHNNGSGPPLYSVALSSPPTQVLSSSSHIPQIFPYLPYSPPPYPSSSQPAEAQHTDPHLTPQHVQYQLDIGAYGIPKLSKPNPARRDWLSLNSRLKNDQNGGASFAVQVGEDAYFVTDNAMGVADGVGGWKNRSGVAIKPTETPSALFASRLMHYCSDEVSNCHPGLFSHTHLEPCTSGETQETQDLLAELEDSLFDMEEGVDVLMVLENAYDRAIKAHVTPIPASESQNRDPTSSSLPSSNPEIAYRPLNAGSSTALLAILQHPAARRPSIRPASSRRHRSSSRSRTSQSERAEEIRPRSTKSDAVIKIANLGDSMAMLVRGPNIIWRSEEMWWSFNTPVQLGPASPSRPKDAQVFELAVEADDILILASDGLSDNLWDEEILEEVVRVRELLLRHTLPWGGDENGVGMNLLARRSLAGMLSEALCSKARRVADRGPIQAEAAKPFGTDGVESCDEIPFARRAREEGKRFKGGKVDDISVLVAVVSPVDSVTCS